MKTIDTGKEAEDLKTLKSYMLSLQHLCKDNTSMVHASNILKKSQDCIKDDASSPNKVKKLLVLIPEYLKYQKNQQNIKIDITGCSTDSFCEKKRKDIDTSIEKRAELLNQYYRFFEDHGIESKEGFDSRSKIRSTILEEFMSYLFRDFVLLLVKSSGRKKDVIKNGSIDAYSNLYFTATNINDFISAPSIRINTKQQDYAIYREVGISIKNAASSYNTANIPILAIENKTFLDKTMLEGSIATAEKIKMGAPYSVYIVATETYAVDFKVDPVYSRIDQIFVLRKCKQKKNDRLPQDIDAEVLKKLFWYVVQRLLRPWSDIKKKISMSGTIM